MRNNGEYLSAEFNDATKYTSKFLVTKVIHIVSTVTLTIVLLSMGTSFSKGIIGLIALAITIVLTMISATFNILGVIKFSNCFGEIDYRRNWLQAKLSLEENHNRHDYSHEMLLTFKNVRNFLWMHLGIAVIGSFGSLVAVWFPFFLMVPNIILIIFIWKYMNKLKDWWSTGKISEQIGE